MSDLDHIRSMVVFYILMTKNQDTSYLLFYGEQKTGRPGQGVKTGHLVTLCTHPPWMCLTLVWFVPMSTVKKCSTVSFPVTGNMTCLDAIEPFAFGSRCNFTCKEGFNLRGETSLSCLATGEWSSPPPTCTGGSCWGRRTATAKRKLASPSEKV